MARPIPVLPQHQPLLDRARESLSKSGGGIWTESSYKTFRASVHVSGEWRGRHDVKRVGLIKGTLSGWIATYTEPRDNGAKAFVWACTLPSDLNPEEAEQAAENVMHLINIRRRE